jgi:hypothetical protein
MAATQILRYDGIARTLIPADEPHTTDGKLLSATSGVRPVAPRAHLSHCGVTVGLSSERIRQWVLIANFEDAVVLLIAVPVVLV